MANLKARQQLGKYKIRRKLAEGGFGMVYEARDTIEGIDVALKVPFKSWVKSEVLGNFQKESRIVSTLDHPNILPIKNAEIVDGEFVIVYPLGEDTLEERLSTRMTTLTCFDYAEQLLAALSHAHAHHIIHCDVKPDNMILFQGGILRLTDFGIARVRLRTITGMSAGTLGYMAPEQALGRPSFRSDVFSAGLVIYRMLSGELPVWPYKWPLPGLAKVRTKVPQGFVAFLRKALEVDDAKRFANAVQMEAAFLRLKPAAIRYASGQRRRARKKSATSAGSNTKGWKQMREREFLRVHRKDLEIRDKCRKCGGPTSEHMQNCPWCGVRRAIYKGPSRFPAHCPRCKRGVKLDWNYCGWCFGPAIGPGSDRHYSDRHYEAKCGACGGELMKHMRYCPWCKTKVRRKWKVAGSSERCTGCGNGILRDYWDHCPWCGKTIKHAKRTGGRTR